VLTNVLTILSGAILFLFLFWKRLKEDYSGNEIFSTSFFILFGIGLGYFTSKMFLPRGWFWLSFLGSVLGFWVGLAKYHLRFYETFQAVFVSLFPWLFFVFLNDSVKNSSWISFSSFVALALIYSLFYYLEGNYKNFFWYRSGKIGFSGLVTAGIFFLARTVVALFFPFVLSFLGKSETFFSGIIAIIFFLLAINLSRRKT
jgi:hypothetical protein